MDLRIATTADAEALYELHHACWREAYAELMAPEVIQRVFADRDGYVARRREKLDDPQRPTYLAASDDGTLVGFATAGPARLDDPPVEFELYGIYTRASVWSSGVGQALFDAAVGVRPAYLWVLEGNVRAIGFYRRHGFELDGVEDPDPDGLHLRMVRG